MILEQNFSLEHIEEVREILKEKNWRKLLSIWLTATRSFVHILIYVSGIRIVFSWMIIQKSSWLSWI